ncbi:hypothetical protein LZ519_03440 [Sphingomonas sp. RG327]|jgi:hypothetical protein|uniref:Uncharacterized protein n=1 Tax=Sphingomonas anseongensis TaxID=2908207 RepID=A0ABT0RDP7_9SPHN|nr:hypothetical protein [Sphingomonas anseongensis]MCL6678371.1 hypothetical protein [Sphingomonas anseongensis]
MLDQIDTDRKKFWEVNGPAFKETVRLAIRETSEALLLQRMPATLRTELEGQLEWLKSYLEQDTCRASHTAQPFAGDGRPRGVPSALN